MSTLSVNFSTTSLKSKTSRACDVCHIKKTKCVKTEAGKCLACVKRNSDCTYNIAPVKRGPKPTKNISKSSSPNLDIPTFGYQNYCIESENQLLVPFYSSELNSDAYSEASFDTTTFSEAMNVITEGFEFDINLLLPIIPNISLIPYISDIFTCEVKYRSLMLSILKETLEYLSSNFVLTFEQGMFIMDFFKNHGDPNTPLEKIIMAFALLPVGSSALSLLINSICTAYVCRIFSQEQLSLLIKYYEVATSLLYQVNDELAVDPYVGQTYYWSKWLLESVSLILN